MYTLKITIPVIKLQGKVKKSRLYHTEFPLNMSHLATVLLVITLILLVPALVYCRVRMRIIRNKLKTALHNSAEISNFINLLSRNLSNMDDPTAWLSITARYVADLVEAQSICIFVLDQDGTYRASGIAGAFPPLFKTDAYVMTKPKYILEALRKERIRPGDGIIGEVALKREAILIASPGDHRLSGMDSAGQIETLMAVPMIDEGVCRGVICAVNSKHLAEHSFNSDQFGRLKFIAAQVVLAQNILKAYSNLSEQQRINQELDFARNLQSSLLPTSFPDWGAFKIHAFTRASKEVSGDFYDFVEIDHDRMLVVIGDACGKGIPACMIMAMTRSFIRANIGRFTTMQELLVNLNDNLQRDTGDGRYITLGLCLLNRRESTLEFARAGHSELIVYVRNHLRAINPEGAGLGLIPTEYADFDTFCSEFTPDMEILLFTDGINEAVSPFGEFFGTERIKKIFMDSCLAGDMPDTSISKIMKAVDDFTESPISQSDDQTMVIIRHN